MKVSYSTVFEQTADQVWAVIRDFNSYPVWVASVTESHIEDDKSGDTVGVNLLPGNGARRADRRREPRVPRMVGYLRLSPSRTGQLH
jgi:hypothetical protein